MRKLYLKKGFTLPEMLIVLGIISILVVIAIPLFSGFSRDSKIDEIKADIMKLSIAQENYYSSRGSYAARLSDLKSFGYKVPDNNKKKFYTGVIIDGDLGMAYWVAGNYAITSSSSLYKECWIYFGANVKTGETENLIRMYNEKDAESRVLSGCPLCPVVADICK